MDLDPTIELRRAGVADPRPEFVRALEPADIALAQGGPPPQAEGLKALRDRHHWIARMLASGKRPAEVCAVTGYSASRISVLQNDPAFKELLAFYRDQADAAYADLHERLATLSGTAVALLAERMETDPDAMADATLLEVAKMGADRTGHGPQSKSVNVNVNVGLADRLAASRARIEAYRAGDPPVNRVGADGPVIEGTLALPPPNEESPA